jgi:hypothetical protein
VQDSLGATEALLLASPAKPPLPGRDLGELAVVKEQAGADSRVLSDRQGVYEKENVAFPGSDIPVPQIKLQ